MTSQLPSFDQLPKFEHLTGCAWGVWGKDDQLGTVNLLTEKVVAEAAKEIKTGKTVCLNWPINFPAKPLFNRKTPSVRSFVIVPDKSQNDDEIFINTQSGSQWDGLKHYGIPKHAIFYNNTPADDIHKGELLFHDPASVDAHSRRLGIQNWAQHGIVGRGVFLDMVKYYTAGGSKPLPYDPWTTHAVPASDLKACAKQQGVTFKQGDILIIREGFMARYLSATSQERNGLADKPEAFAGIKQDEDMKRFLWDNHFAAIASDQPAIERWPAPEGTPYLHEV
ncbi:hypothetical protein EIP91_004459 [Steccherinum ochraceum]|uniref:Cyclase n=1 Tax=Steccherinum ochraceum TaxID=92696 RepID=A0A4R0RP73_9APHY|nr:hypothetical protein EIP91_004459 [Steccherinum ochraceum]